MKIVEGYYIPWLEVLLFIGIAVALRWHHVAVDSLQRQLHRLQKEITELRSHVHSLQFRDTGTKSGPIMKSVESVDEDDEIPF